MLQTFKYRQNQLAITADNKSADIHLYVQKMIYCILLLCASLGIQAQPPCKHLDTMLAMLTIVTSDFPPDIKNASYRYSGERAKVFDTIEELFTSGVKELAEHAGRRSAILNSYAGFQEADVLPFSPIPVNQQLQDYFVKQGYKIESLDRSMNAFLKGLDKTIYQRLGYSGAHDSAYRKRLPQLKKYSTAVIAQVNEEIHFLKKNQHLLKSNDEQVRIKYLEKYLTVLGRLLNLNSTARRVLVKDGAEIYTFCQQYPAACEKYAQ